jgi:hypothetical protein
MLSADIRDPSLGSGRGYDLTDEKIGKRGDVMEANSAKRDAVPAARPTESTPTTGSPKWIKIRNGAFWVLLAVVGFVLNDAYSAARDWATNKPDYLKDLAQKQDKQFDELKQSLGSISGSINSGDRKAFRQVKDAVDAMGKTNSGLIQQLVLAKQENEALRKVAGEKAGVSGGYDFMLTEGGGMRIDPSTVLGLSNVAPQGVYANLTSKGADAPQSTFLKVGQSLAYNSADGKSCKVSLVSLNPDSVGAATFVVGCS